MTVKNEINIFEKFGQYYDKMIPWEKRLKNEEPFFKEFVDSGRVKSLLDVGCGTGRHAIMFAKMGLEVTAVDPSAEMIKEARKNSYAEHVEITLMETGMGRLGEINKNFDLVTCLGNSLAHMRDEESLQQALHEFYNCLSADGVLVIQMRNYDKVFLNRERFMPLNSFEDDEQEILFLRMTDLIEDKQVQFSILLFHREKGRDWKLDVLSETLAPWRKQDLTKVLDEIGFKAIKTYGNYNKGPWSREESTDLIIAAEK